MKSLKIIFVFFTITLSAFAQNTKRERDTSWTNSRNQPYLNQILNADVLSGITAPEAISPQGQKLCFDKKIKVKSVTDRGIAETCLFLNTKTGLVGHLPVKHDGTSVCDIKPELSDFVFYIIGLKGNTYHYFNTKKNGIVEHWVVTNNSNAYQYQFTGSTSVFTLHKKAEQRRFCNDKIKTWAYKTDGGSDVWFLFGETFPEQLNVSANKFLGNYGVGYLYTDKGLFINMQLEADGYNSKIVDIQEVNICFDPSGFKVHEDEFYTKKAEEIKKEREKIAKAEAKIKPDDCEYEQRKLIRYQYESLNRQEENLTLSRQGNLNQQIPVQQARIDLMINYDDIIEASILETQIRICRTQKKLDNSSDAFYRQPSEKKLACLKEQLAAQKQIQKEMLQINKLYPNDPGKKHAEKSKIYLKGMKVCD